MPRRLGKSDFRFIRKHYRGKYFMPTVPQAIQEFLGWNQDGDTYQWDVHEIDGRKVITLERNPQSPPDILRKLGEGIVQ